MALLDKLTQRTGESAVSLTNEEVDRVITSNLYTQGDTVTATLKKYENLCQLKKKCLEKAHLTKLHDAMLVFVNSIGLFTKKEQVLEFLINAIQYTRTSTINDAINVAADLSFKAAKTASLVGKVATLGMASKVMDQAEKLTKKALTTNDTELANIWTQKIEAQIKAAKREHGGMFGGDKEFIKRLDELKKQLDNK